MGNLGQKLSGFNNVKKENCYAVMIEFWKTILACWTAYRL